MIEQICWDIVAESLDYVELKFSIDKYIKYFSPVEIITLIHSKMNEEAQKWGFSFGLVLSLKYESDRTTQRYISKIIENPDIANCLVGLDTVGNEEFFEYCFYQPILQEWRKYGKGLQMHVGETQSSENVKAAIELGVDRIAHGIHAVNDTDTMRLATEKDICFDIALTSNVYTGIVRSYSEHPIKQMIDAGCIISIGTDDPYVLQTKLNNEYQHLSNICSDDVLYKVMKNSVDYAFKTPTYQ